MQGVAPRTMVGEFYVHVNLLDPEQQKHVSSCVWLVEHVRTNRWFVMKTPKPGRPWRAEENGAFLVKQAIDEWRKEKGESAEVFIVELVDSKLSEDSRILCVELCSFGSIFFNRQPPSLLFVQFVTKCTARGLQVLHSFGLAHCDLKPDNIVLSDEVFLCCFLFVSN